MLSCIPLLFPAIIGTCRPVENRNMWTRPTGQMAGAWTWQLRFLCVSFV